MKAARRSTDEQKAARLESARSEMRARCERYLNDPTEARWLELRAARWRFDREARA